MAVHSLLVFSKCIQRECTLKTPPLPAIAGVLFRPLIGAFFVSQNLR